MEFTEKCKKASLDQLEANLAALREDICLLTDYWNKNKGNGRPAQDYDLGPTLAQVKDPRYWAGLKRICEGSTIRAHWAEVLEFIHNFCTFLCGEKNYLEGEIYRRSRQ